MPLDIAQIRQQFPALKRGDVFFDNPGGTQVPQVVIDRMVDYLTRCNTNRGGAFATSIESDAIQEEARAACANFLNAACPEEIVFGPNMTTLTLSLARAFGRTLNPELTVFHRQRHLGVDVQVQLPVGPLHLERQSVERDVHPLWDGHRLLSNA